MSSLAGENCMAKLVGLTAVRPASHEGRALVQFN
jgi:hypothetical protein